ncbi:hypothetical protein WJX72_008815 [[Myrmecia] bisecta]|uniref:Centrosomal protein of 76 kDa n=1 Tax=[Myrmecia] bisecta TaxID=41462 RepID=A0AAW1QS05_9CHLO
MAGQGEKPVPTAAGPPSSTSSSLPPEQITELRKVVKERLKNLGVNDQVRTLVAATKNTTNGDKVRTKEQAIQELKGRGVIDQLVKSLGSAADLVDKSKQPAQATPAAHAAGSQTGRKSPTEPTKQGKRYLHVKIKGGSKFARYATKDPEPYEQLVVAGELFGQRFRSTAVSAGLTARVEVSALVEVPGGAGAEVPQLTTLRQQLHLVVLRTFPAAIAPGGRLTGLNGTQPLPDAPTSAAEIDKWSLHSEIVGTASVDWRRALCSRGAHTSFSLELLRGVSPGPRSQDVMGVLGLELEVLPPPSKPADATALKAQLEHEQKRELEGLESFTARAKAWWSEYVQSNATFKERLVKLLAYGEDGLQRPTCTYVKSLQLGRHLASPREAARFVSLMLPKDETHAEECWASLHTVVASGMASQEEKALLLCGLLIGFGLDAWVCVGADVQGPHMWVMTRAAPKGGTTFWEPSTGVRYNPGSSGQHRGCPYRSLDSVFNHRRLFANCQEDNSIRASSYAFEDSSLWRELVMQPQDSPAAPWVRFDLLMPPLDTGALELRLETELKRLISDYRAVALGLPSTQWDDAVGYLLMPSLAAYEQEAVSGSPASGNEEFQQSIKRSVPAGCIFKGFPQHHRSLSRPRIAAALLKEHAVADMLAVSAPDASFALRLRITQYPENVVSAWLMLAVKYR